MSYVNTNLSMLRRARSLERVGFRQLLRRPLVQMGLLGTAVLQTAAVTAEAQPRLLGEPVLLGTPVTMLQAVTVEPEVATTYASAAVASADDPEPKDASGLAEKYRRQGYSVSNDLAGKIVRAARRHGIDLDVAFGLVRAESSFRNSATSPVGAVGLTQLMPATARWIEPGVSQSALRDPDTNLNVGFKYLRYLMNKYGGDEKLALLAYNRGPGTVDKALKRGRNPDNGYAAFVKGATNHGHKLYSE